ncbi:uncharacterized protein DEA37_0006514 [Paragonimus westermani]|uniref:Uncharacterized protein n=1 Tax=Paragonimus westermani TaxID=34504 RepID=A0A5J4NU58_9TREM|nr:uncharacterized protein DEA37_0006514 [Paragonimus westermani]
MCDQSVTRSANCPARLIRGKYYYERSLNRQCGRNPDMQWKKIYTVNNQKTTVILRVLKERAAPLPDDPNSFYCTRNTPLVSELFGETTKERLVDETESSCDGYRRNCMACINQAERVLQTEQANATHCVYAHVSRVRDTGESEEEDQEPSQDGTIQSETAAHCCSLSCYNTPACMTYHSAACYKDTVEHNLVPDSDVCLEGTWRKNGCDLNISKFVRVQPIHIDEGKLVTPFRLFDRLPENNSTLPLVSHMLLQCFKKIWLKWSLKHDIFTKRTFSVC